MNKLIKLIFIVISTTLITLGNILAIVTSFNLEINIQDIIYLVIAVSFIVTILSYFKTKYIFYIFMVILLLIFIYYNYKEILNGLYIILKTILDLYKTAYSGFEDINIEPLVGLYPSYDLFQKVFAVCLAMYYSYEIANDNHYVMVGSVSVLLLFLSLNIVDHMPSALSLVLLLTGSIPLVMINSIKDKEYSYKLGIILLVPIYLITTLFSNYFSSIRYIRPLYANNMRDDLKEIVDEHPIFEGDDNNGKPIFDTYSAMGGREAWNRDIDQVNLRALGPRFFNDETIFYATLQNGESKEYYLKTYSLGKYEDSTWLDIDNSEYEYLDSRYSVYGWPFISIISSRSFINIATNEIMQTMIIPYNYLLDIPSESEIFKDKYVRNSSIKLTYSIPFSQVDNLYESNAEYDEFVKEHYLEISDTQFNELTSAFNELESLGMSDVSLSTEDKVNIIVEYVKSKAKYDVNTGSMSGNKDFVAWFLEDSETGYCVHYATAAAILLRCYGIPSRYVNGYMVTLKENTEVAVTDRNAHAWVEYYDSERGWIMVEATPGSEESEGVVDNEEEEVINEEIDIPIDEDNNIDNEEVIEVDKTNNIAKYIPVILIIIIILLIRLLILYIDKYRLFKGTNNEKCIKRYKYLNRLTKLSDANINEIKDLAYKAKFSNHIISDEELAYALEFIKTERNRKDISIFKRFIRYLLFARM